MLIDDVIYVSLMLASVAIGYHIQNVKDSGSKQFQSTLIGVFLVLIVSGLHIVHPILVTLVNAFIVLFCSKRYCHAVSFAFCFTYLAFFRMIHFLGFEAPPAHTNAIQMILTLKMVGLAYEANESWKLSKNQTTANRVLKLSFLDIFNYAFCYAGVLIGPYYRYRTYQDMIGAPYQIQIQSQCFSFLKKRIKVVPLYIAIFLFSQYFFPIDYVNSDEILDTPLWYRIFYMSPIFLNFRMRIYTGFILAECVCIMAGLGIYPECSKPEPGAGPTDFQALYKFENSPLEWKTSKYSHETIHNIQEYGSEFLPLIRDGIRSWNRTVQYWLAVYIYKQLPFSKPIRMVLTMLISSFWHGVHPGYYMCLMSAPLFLLAEVQMENAFRKDVSRWRRILFDWIWWIIKMQAFAYMGMAFILLRIDSTFYYWMSIYFVGHLMVLAFYGLGSLVSRFRKLKIHSN